MSVLDEKYQKYVNSKKMVVNSHDELDYQEELKIAVENGGGGGDVFAVDVISDGPSNVQADIDSLDTRIDDVNDIATDNQTEIGDITGRLDNLSSVDVALLGGGTVRDLSKIAQRYSALTVFCTFSGTFNIAVGAPVNLFDMGLTFTESPLIEGLGESYTGQDLIEWIGLYVQDSIGSTTYTGSMIDATNKVFKMPDAEAQTNGFWKTYLLDVSLRIDGSFTGTANSSNELVATFSDSASFAARLGFLDPSRGQFQASQEALVSRINKDTSQLVQNGLTLTLEALTNSFDLTNVELMIRVSH